MLDSDIPIKMYGIGAGIENEWRTSTDPDIKVCQFLDHDFDCYHEKCIYVFNNFRLLKFSYVKCFCINSCNI